MTPTATPTPILNGDSNRDGVHDVILGDIYEAEALLVAEGHNTMLFRIATFTSAAPGMPTFDVPLDGFCIPVNFDGPPATGTSDIQLIGRLLAMRGPFQYRGQQYSSVRAGQPTAVQYSIDGGYNWLWVSDLLVPKL